MAIPSTPPIARTQRSVRRAITGIALAALVALGMLLGTAAMGLSTASAAEAATPVRWASPLNKRPASFICWASGYRICKTEKICWKGDYRIAYTSTRNLPTNCLTYRY